MEQSLCGADVVVNNGCDQFVHPRPVLALQSGSYYFLLFSIASGRRLIISLAGCGRRTMTCVHFRSKPNWRATPIALGEYQPNMPPSVVLLGSCAGGPNPAAEMPERPGTVREATARPHHTGPPSNATLLRLNYRQVVRAHRTRTALSACT